MTRQYTLSPADAAALRAGEGSHLPALRQHLRQWINTDTTTRTTAWQLRGLPLRLSQLGPTPSTSGDLDTEAAAAARIVEWLGACLGTCVTFPGMKQAAHAVQQVFPVRHFEDRQSAASSRAALAWHTEHADKDEPPDFLIIACLRNDDGVGTRVSQPLVSRIERADIALLASPTAFHFSTRSPTAPAIAVLEPNRLRYDPVYCRPINEVSRHVLQKLAEEIERNALVLPQEPGTAWIIPNRHTVHARESFQARYDGTDRWLLRTMIRAC